MKKFGRERRFLGRKKISKEELETLKEADSNFFKRRIGRHFRRGRGKEKGKSRESPKHSRTPMFSFNKVLDRRHRTYMREEDDRDIDLIVAPKMIQTAEKEMEKLPDEKAMEDSRVEWAKEICRNGIRPLLKEFSAIRKYESPDMVIDAFLQHPDKNRYADIMCIDQTRVRLRDRPKENDYIHANWINLPSRRRYICTQGPLDDTVEDFWFMIFKENVKAIIMLCDFVEDGEGKCYEYYPLTVGEKTRYGNMIVKNEKLEEPVETITCEMITIQHEGEKHKVLHYKWLDWPDHSAPQTTTPILSLIEKLKPLHKKGPIAVHCSAGVGRTGTFCAIDYSIDRLNEKGITSGTEVFIEIRQQRHMSIQSAPQFLYIHMCLIDYVSNIKPIPCPLVQTFREQYGRYLRQHNDAVLRRRQSCGKDSKIE